MIKDSMVPGEINGMCFWVFYWRTLWKAILPVLWASDLNLVALRKVCAWDKRRWRLPIRQHSEK